MAADLLLLPDTYARAVLSVFFKRLEFNNIFYGMAVATAMAVDYLSASRSVEDDQK